MEKNEKKILLPRICSLAICRRRNISKHRMMQMPSVDRAIDRDEEERQKKRERKREQKSRINNYMFTSIYFMCDHNVY